MLILSAFTEEEALDPGVIDKVLRELPDQALRLGLRVVLAIVVFLIGVQLIKLVRRLVQKSLSRGNVDAGAVHFIDSFIKAALYLVLVFMIGSWFGLDAASVVAVVGSAGVAIGLAIQGSLSNFVGGVLILVLKPFKVGDYIREDTKGNEGTVTQIELFYTRLTTADNRIIILPNGILANASLTNVTACDSRRMDIYVGISYQADIRQAKSVLQEVLDRDEAVLKDQDHFVYVNELADSAVNLGVRCYMKNEDFWAGKWRITENVKYALDAAGIGIPYPQREIHLNES